jgi:hypothetical protein
VQVASLAITPNPATVAVGGQQQFTATLTVAGVAVPARIQWSLQGPRKRGVSWGSISRDGLYTAPAQVPPAYLGWPAGYIRVRAFAYFRGSFAPAIASADVNITSAPASPAPPAGLQRLFIELYDRPDDLAWHQGMLWGVNLVADASVSEIDIAAVNRAIAAGQPLPFRISPYEKRRFTKIAPRNTSCSSAQSLALLGPTGLTADGGALWLATYFDTYYDKRYDKRIWRVIPDLVDAECLREVDGFAYRPLGATNGGPRGLAWDWGRGTLWVADDVHGRVYEFNWRTGAVVSFFDSPSTPDRPRGQPTGLAFDGTHLRLATYQDARLWTLTRAGAVVAETASPGSGPVGLTWENGRLFSDDDVSDELHVQ